jgi:predicted nucleic acid-binding protein
VIIVDTNVVAYLYYTGPYTAVAQQAFVLDPVWAAPHLWRSEMRNILARYLQRQLLTLPLALEIMRDAEQLLYQNEYEVESGQVLELATQSGCTAYDCEFVVLAQNLQLPLITVDQQLIRAFPQIAIPLEAFVSRANQ